METARVLLAAVLVIATLLPLWRHDAWWVRACEFPRVQIMIFGLALVATYLLFAPRTTTARIALALALPCVAFQAYRIFPYTPLASKQVQAAAAPRAGASVSLLVANVLMDNRRAEGLIEHVRRQSPDLIFSIETDDWWRERLRELDADYPYVVEQPLANTYGMLLHSRWELIDARIRFLVEKDVPSIHAKVRLPAGRRVQLHLLHPKPPHPAETLETTERDGELLLVGREVGRNDEPTIVAGDLNDVAWSYTTRLLQRISGLLDPRIGRGLYSTYHARVPILRWPLDHVFHSDHFELVRLERLAGFGSDHFPVLAELALDPRAPYQQQEPLPEAGDLERVEDKIEESEPRTTTIMPERDGNG